jgi:arsenate reductase
MLVLGLQGSPRKKGNTEFLLNEFMKESKKKGAHTHIIDACGGKINHCIGCGNCEKKGFCVFDDEMSREIYPLLRRADVILLATPVYFYNTTSHLKTLIDRGQALWSRRYKYLLEDPYNSHRRGVVLSIGATKGDNLFDGINLTAKYFFDAVGAVFDGGLTYRRIEERGAISAYPGILNDIKNEVERIITPYLNRKKILFACRENACRSQMASAFAQYIAGDRIEAFSGGSSPADKMNPVMVEAMNEKGLDMAYKNPQSIDFAVSQVTPDIIVTMGCGEECPFVPGAEIIDWDLPDPAVETLDFMRNVRDEIERKVFDLADGL